MVLYASALLLSGCAAPPVQQAGLETSGRWRIFQGEFKSSDREEKRPILLDTQTGETWQQAWDTNRGLVWHRLAQDR
jgi:hypothetical protein